MAHRETRDRGGAWGDRSDRDDRVRREAREPNRDRERGDRERERDRDRDAARGGLNDFFVDGEGIHREVMQREICKYLGPEAYSRPGVYNSINGYIVTAVRPFTAKMIDDLQALSREFISENRDLSRRGHEGVSYAQSQASRQFDRRLDGNMMGSPDVYNDPRYNQPQPGYSSGGAQPGYISTNYATGANFPPQQMTGYESGPGYAQGLGYPVGTAYPQTSGYPTTTGYPTASGYTIPGYPAPAGRHGNVNESNYTYNNATGDYANPNAQYRQQNPFPTGTRPGDTITDPARAGPRYQQFVSSPGENPIRGAPAYDSYGQQIVPGQPNRGQFAAAPRGQPSGYDGQPLDGGHVLDERRRR